MEIIRPIKNPTATKIIPRGSISPPKNDIPEASNNSIPYTKLSINHLVFNNIYFLDDTLLYNLIPLNY